MDRVLIFSLLFLVASQAFGEQDLSKCDGTLNQPIFCPIDGVNDMSMCDGTLDEPLYCSLRSNEVQDKSLCDGTINQPIYCNVDEDVHKKSNCVGPWQQRSLDCPIDRSVQKPNCDGPWQQRSTNCPVD